VTDVVLEHRKGLTNLGELWLADATATDAGVARLQQALPRLPIYR
jgi:hypothetical protein